MLAPYCSTFKTILYGFGSGFRLAKICSKQQQPRCKQRFTPILKCGISSLAKNPTCTSPSTAHAGPATVVGPMSLHCSDYEPVLGGIPASVPHRETHALTNSERRDKE